MKPYMKQLRSGHWQCTNGTVTTWNIVAAVAYLDFWYQWTQFQVRMAFARCGW